MTSSPGGGLHGFVDQCSGAPRPRFRRWWARVRSAAGGPRGAELVGLVAGGPGVRSAAGRRGTAERRRSLEAAPTGPSSDQGPPRSAGRPDGRRTARVAGSSDPRFRGWPRLEACGQQVPGPPVRGRRPRCRPRHLPSAAASGCRDVESDQAAGLAGGRRAVRPPTGTSDAAQRGERPPLETTSPTRPTAMGLTAHSWAGSGWRQSSRAGAHHNAGRDARRAGW